MQTKLYIAIYFLFCVGEARTGNTFRDGAAGLQFVSTQLFGGLIVLVKNIMAIKIGQAAPDFTLVNSDKKEVTLSALRGSNVVLLFFPMAFTSVCTTELCTVRDNISRYNSANAKVLGISVDSPFTLAKFKEDQGLNFDLLSDFNKEVSTAYGALYPEFAFGMKGVSKRAAFVIDKEGEIRYAEVLENAGEQPDFGKIVATLDEILLTV